MNSQAFDLIATRETGSFREEQVWNSLKTEDGDGYGSRASIVSVGVY